MLQGASQQLRVAALGLKELGRAGRRGRGRSGGVQEYKSEQREQWQLFCPSHPPREWPNPTPFTAGQSQVLSPLILTCTNKASTCPIKLARSTEKRRNFCFESMYYCQVQVQTTSPEGLGKRGTAVIVTAMN